jgi:TRAP-type mannitol/chloroaromatic compound transport system permease large subunit
VPFVIIQLVTLLALMLFPEMSLWLPDLMDSLQ